MLIRDKVAEFFADLTTLKYRNYAKNRISGLLQILIKITV